jgi:hypothetical protein
VCPKKEEKPNKKAPNLALDLVPVLYLLACPLFIQLLQHIASRSGFQETPNHVFSNAQKRFEHQTSSWSTSTVAPLQH